MTGILLQQPIMSQDSIKQQSKTAGYSRGWKSTVVGSMTPLSASFVPGPYDVICSRGKKAKTHGGNLFFQSIVENTSEKYSQAEGKLGKSIIVSEIIDTVRGKSPNGGFVKQDGDQWYEVGDWAAREKVGQSLRDLLSGKYRSSASSKKRRREESNAKMIEDLDSLIESNSYVSKRMRNLSDTIETKGSQVSDLYLMVMMTQANTEILDQLKQDNSVQRTVNAMGGSKGSKSSSDEEGREGKQKARKGGKPASI